MPTTRKSYRDEFKFQVVLETFSPYTTITQVAKKHRLHLTQLNQWRKIFKDNGHLAFAGTTSKSKTKKIKPDQDPTQLKEIIGDLTVENTILKKAMSVWD